MADIQQFFSPSRRLFLGGLAVGIAVVLLFNSWSDNHRATFYPTRIEPSAKALLGYVSCTSTSNGSYIVSGNVIAQPDSGVLKIGASVNFGDTGPFNAQNVEDGWYTYFDTNDPAYGQQGGGVLTFTVLVGNGVSGTVSTGSAPKFCSVYVSQRF